MYKRQGKEQEADSGEYLSARSGDNDPLPSPETIDGVDAPAISSIANKLIIEIFTYICYLLSKY